MKIESFLVDSTVEYSFNGLYDIGIVKFTYMNNGIRMVAVRHCDGSLLNVPAKNCVLLYVKIAKTIYDAKGDLVE